MKNILITGSPGSGKSYLTKKLIEKGINAIDGDYMFNVVQWINKTTHETDPFPNKIEDADAKWLNNHKFIWHPDRLDKFIKENEPIIILGLCDNLEKIVKYFDKVYYLKVPIDLVKDRLLRPDRQKSNAFGRDQEQINKLGNMIKELNSKALKLNFEILDVNSNEDEILDLLDI